MMRLLRRLVVVGALLALATMVVRHLRGSMGHTVAGGVLIGNVGAYDTVAGRLLSSFYGAVARDVANALPAGGRILEIGCGPGRLSVRLASEHGLDVVGVDLDPAMVERAVANATTAGVASRTRFVVADAANLPFADGSFDMVVSTLSMHHWSEPAAGLAEIGRVLAPAGRALIWDLRRGAPLHAHAPDPVEQAHLGPLHVVDATPWRWPWNFSLTQRIQLAHQSEYPDRVG